MNMKKRIITVVVIVLVGLLLLQAVPTIARITAERNLKQIEEIIDNVTSTP